MKSGDASASGDYYNNNRNKDGLFNFLAVVFVTANLIQNTRFLNYLMPEYIQIIYGLQIVVIFIFIIKNILDGKYINLFITFLIGAYFAFQCFLFSENTGTEININSAFSYLLLTSYLIFSTKNINMNSLLKYTYTISCVYCILYIVMAVFFPKLVTNYEGVNGVDYSFKLLGRDHYKDARVFICNSFISYGLIYSLYSVVKKMDARNLVMIALFFISILLANSRAYSIVIALIIMATFLIKRPILRQIIFSSVFLLGSFVVIWGSVDPKFNFFSYFSGDDSGYSRFIEYEGAKTIQSAHPILGLGIPSSLSVAQAVANTSRAFFLDDIGAMGILTGFGVFGFILYVGLGVLCGTFHARKTGTASVGENALASLGLFIVSYSLIAPTFWGGSSTMFAALIMAYSFKSVGGNTAARGPAIRKSNSDISV